MRYLLPLLLFGALVTAGGCSDNKGPVSASSPANDSTTIQWLDSARDFGKIEEGQKLEVSFRYKNTGDKPLVISRVEVSCGCTVASQSNEPVAPGALSAVKAVFNSDGHQGVNHKTLYVYSNAKGVGNNIPLQFVVEVEKKK
jgi:hypothetical protein